MHAIIIGAQLQTTRRGNPALHRGAHDMHPHVCVTAWANRAAMAGRGQGRGRIIVVCWLLVVISIISWGGVCNGRSSVGANGSSSYRMCLCGYCFSRLTGHQGALKSTDTKTTHPNRHWDGLISLLITIYVSLHISLQVLGLQAGRGHQGDQHPASRRRSPSGCARSGGCGAWTAGASSC